MLCFNHPRTDAIGICKSCAKAICHDCVFHTERGLACSQKCAERIEAVEAMIDRSLKPNEAVRSMLRRTRHVYLIMKRVYIGIGIVILLFGAGILVATPLKSS